MSVKQIGVKQSDGSWSYQPLGAEAANVDIDATHTLADKATEWDNKVDSETGKGLSTNDYTTEEKNKLSGISAGAEANTIESISVNSEPLTPDQNKNVNLEITPPTDVAPTNHASDDSTYGLGTTELYGHIKFGTTAGTAVEGNDSRLSNARTPLEHASTTTEYGAGSSAYYGHVKVRDASSDSVDTAAAASVHSVYTGLNGKGDTFDYNSDTGELSLKSGNTVLSSVTVEGGASAKSQLTVTVDDSSLYGQTITAVLQGGESLSTTVSNAGIATFSLKFVGTYTITCAGYTTTVENAAIGSILNATIHVAKSIITINTTTTEWYSSTATVTKDGSQVGTVTLSNGTGSITVHEAGTYTVTLQGKSSSVTVVLDTNTSVTINDLELVSWSSGTDEQIAAMVAAYYDGSISLSDVKSVWSVGDVRTMHLNAMSAPNRNSSNTWAAQDIRIVILDFDHTELATAINGKTKALITVQTKECMNNGSGNDGTNGIYVNGDSSYDMSFTKWSNLYMRTYLNSTVLGAIPSGDFKSAIKPSKHNRHTTYNGSESEEVTDTLFLPSYPEIFGTASYQYYTPTSPVEGTQFKYYETASNRIKYGNNNGQPSSNVWYWWEGSASSYYDSSRGYRWCFVNTDGSANYYYGDYARGLAPAFAM